jgi:hypothetical protein
MFYWADALARPLEEGARVAFCAALKDKTLEDSLLVIKPILLKSAP